MSLLEVIFLAFFVSAIAFAFWKGGGPERAVAVSFWAASLLTLAVATTVNLRFQQVELGILAVDAILLLALLIIAVKANRRWTLLVATMQILIVMGHTAKAVHPNLARSAYVMVTESWPFLQLTVLMIGTEFHRQRRKRDGYVRSWSKSSQL